MIKFGDDEKLLKIVGFIRVDELLLDVFAQERGLFAGKTVNSQQNAAFPKGSDVRVIVHEVSEVIGIV